MARFIKNRTKLVGKAPGSLVFLGNKKMDKPRFRMISYNEKEISEYETETIDGLITNCNKSKINWINIDGLHDMRAIEMLGKSFGLSALIQEDIVNTDQRPKLIEDNNHLVCFLKQLTIDKQNNIRSDQITIIVGSNFVITIQEKVGQFFDSIRERIRNKVGRITIAGPDYLFYRIIDTVADDYMVCIETLGSDIEQNEQDILSKVNKEIVEQIYMQKTEVSFIRKIIRPVKEITAQLKRSESEFIHKETRSFINDLDDIITHTLETVDIYYLMISDQLNIYNTNLSNRANDVMKVLTIFAAIFIPLTFIAGVYGTNFEYVPELGFRYSYFIMWAIMLIVAGFMLLYFKRKKWL